jgi:dihydrolipoamide dehydrogenase
MGANKGILRVYGDRSSGQLLGAEMIGPSAEHLAHLLSWSIQQKMQVHKALQMPFYHPVVEEGLRTALRNLLRQTDIDGPHFEMSMCDAEAEKILN